MWDIHRAQRLLFFIQMTAAPGINDGVNETLGITVELENTSQAADFFNQILFLAYGGWKLYCEDHMWWVVGVEVQVLASVGWFPVDFGG
jgi:hypothetical protein